MALASAASKFLLEFRIQDDGLDSGAAQQMASKRTGSLRAGADAGSHTDFAYFPQLPPELRLKIWDYLITPRIVQIFCVLDVGRGTNTDSRDRTSSDGNDMPPHSHGDMFDIDFTINDYLSPEELRHDLSGRRPPISRIPVILHINREARHHGLRHYELAFSWKVPHVLADLDIRIPPSSSASPLASQPRRSSPPAWSEPQIYFNFDMDAVHLAGELEPCDSYGFNSPMTYFLRKEDCLRVRHVALSFGALHYGATAAQQIFGSLFHVVDRFKPPHGRVLVTVSDRDEGINLMIGAASPLIAPSTTTTSDRRTRETRVDDGVGGLGTPLAYSGGGGMTAMEREYASRPRGGDGPRDNVVQTLWRDWYRGSSHKSHLAKMRFDLIHDWDLADQIAQSDSLVAADVVGLPEPQADDELTGAGGGVVSSSSTDHDGSAAQMMTTNFYDMEEDYTSIPAELRL